MLVTMGTRDEAWLALNAALPPGWRVSLWTFDPAGGRCTVAARGPWSGGRPHDNFIVGRGTDDLAAMWSLVAGLKAPRSVSRA